MNPITKYLKNLFSKNRMISGDSQLQGLVKADAIGNALTNGKKIPGLAISVLKDGRPLFEKGYGYADLANKIPVDPRKTIFRIASVSKPIAATALAHMVKDDIIDLDASFYTYVPYYPKKRWDFTIRQLASHTAGIRGYQGMEYGLNKPYTIKESLEIFKDDDLLFKPGTDYHYNSYDWVLISLAMQEASGIPFEKYVQHKVLTPLGMMNTFAEHFTSAALSDQYDSEGLVTSASPSDQHNFEKVAERSRSYSRNRLGFRKAIPVNNYYKLAGGGYLSTSKDIANFGQAYLDGKISEAKVLAPFLTSQIINGKKTYYGLGWQVSEDKKGRPFYGHIGNGVGGYSNFFIYPEQRMVFAILTNCTNPGIQDSLDQIVDVLLAMEENNYLS